ncbi:MAG: VOC family protein [Acidimicrobiia bacterium]|nr:VOC family protein [Acidimicrobiia bacterium]
MSRIRVTGVDHVVIMTADVERSLGFYVDQLGLEPVRVDEFRRGEVFFPSIRISATTILDLFPAGPDGKNVDHLCLTVDEIDLAAVADSGEFDVVSGPSELFGAQGMGTALYVRDPDGLVIELRHYGTA